MNLADLMRWRQMFNPNPVKNGPRGFTPQPGPGVGAMNPYLPGSRMAAAGLSVPASMMPGGGMAGSMPALKNPYTQVASAGVPGMKPRRAGGLAGLMPGGGGAMPMRQYGGGRGGF